MGSSNKWGEGLKIAIREGRLAMALTKFEQADMPELYIVDTGIPWGGTTATIYHHENISKFSLIFTENPVNKSMTQGFRLPFISTDIRNIVTPENLEEMFCKGRVEIADILYAYCQFRDDWPGLKETKEKILNSKNGTERK